MIETVYESLPDLIPSDAENLAGQDTGRDHLSYSEINDLLACGQKYDFKREQRLEPIEQRPALSMGKAFQRGIEHRDPEVAYMTAMSDPAPIYGQDAHDRRLVQATIVRAAASLYLDTFPGEGGENIREFEYRVRLRNPWTGAGSRTFDLLGYADELAETDEGLVLVENKLVGQVTKQSIAKLPLDRQIAMACYGIWRATGNPVVKVRYRYTRKPSIKQRKNESVGEFCDRIEADYAERPEFYIAERTWYRSTTDLVRTEAEIWEWARQIREARRQHLFPRNTSHCTDFGGCEFLPLCLGDADAPSLFRKRQPRSKEQPVEPVAN